VGRRIFVAGTTATAPDGRIVGIGDPAMQMRQALVNIRAALERAGAALSDVVRTRIYVTRIEDWEVIGRAHGDVFAGIRPACTMVEVRRLIDPAMMVEVEAEAVVNALPSVPRDLTGTWPQLPLAQWRDTYDTLHMWLQMVGKTRLALAPAENCWWHVTLFVTPVGLSTPAIPHDGGAFDVEFDFVHHALHLRTSDGAYRTLALAPRSVADFYGEYVTLLRELGIRVHIWPHPVEVPDPIPFLGDHTHASYDPDAAARFHQVLVRTQHVFSAYRGQFVGKSSPVHFFWGSFDLAVTRFSGRLAPPRPDADRMTQLAYLYEEMSAGFWPGSGPVQEPAFYSYAAPEPAGFNVEPIAPKAAYYHPELKEFILPYEAVRTSNDPDGMLMEFLQSTYRATRTLGKWPENLDATP
jgi:enamine deaminase RidA (YjgF/YER057c/UK114 family)